MGGPINTGCSSTSSGPDDRWKMAISNRLTGGWRDECLNVQVFFTLAEVREKLELWREDYHQVRPHSALDDVSPRVFAANWVRGSAVARSATPAENAPPARCNVRLLRIQNLDSFPACPSTAVKGRAEKLVRASTSIGDERGILPEVLT